MFIAYLVRAEKNGGTKSVLVFFFLYFISVEKYYIASDWTWSHEVGISDNDKRLKLQNWPLGYAMMRLSDQWKKGVIGQTFPVLFSKSPKWIHDISKLWKVWQGHRRSLKSVERAVAGITSNKITAPIIKTLCSHVPVCTCHQITVILGGIDHFSADCIAGHKWQNQFRNIVIVQLTDCCLSLTVNDISCYGLVSGLLPFASVRTNFCCLSVVVNISWSITLADQYQIGVRLIAVHKHQ